MEFKAWFKEWEGNQFIGDADLPYNKAKWQGVKNVDEPSFADKVDKMYGHRRQLVVKRMKKRG